MKKERKRSRGADMISSLEKSEIFRLCNVFGDAIMCATNAAEMSALIQARKGVIEDLPPLVVVAKIRPLFSECGELQKERLMEIIDILEGLHRHRHFARILRAFKTTRRRGATFLRSLEMKLNELDITPFPAVLAAGKLKDRLKPCVLVSPALWARVSELADRTHTTRSEIVRAALTYLLDNLED